MRPLLVALVVLALAGCGAQQKSADTAAKQPASTPAPAADAGAPAGAASGSDATVASAPRQIAELTNQTLIYECPKCGMMFDRAGKCSMGDGDLVATRVDYICPKDGQAVAQAGHCPRCAVNARVEKTAMAAATPTGKN